MEELEVGLRISNNGEQVTQSVKSIKTELREATQDAINLSRKFGEFSPQALEASQRVANLKDEIGDFKQRVDALNPDAKFRAFSTALQGVAGGFAGVQGAIGLFATENKELEKQLLKVQSALALSEGLNSVLEAKDAFKNLGAVAVNAFNSIKTAIGATGIGLLVVALGTIVANWDAIKASVTGVSEEQENLNRLTEKNVKAQQDKLDELDSQDAVLKQQGLSEKDILKLKEKQTQELIKQQIIQLENAKNNANAELERTSKAFAKTASAFSSIAGTAGGLAIAGLIFDPGKTAQRGAETVKALEKSLNESKNKLATYQNEITELEKPKPTSQRVRGTQEEKTFGEKLGAKEFSKVEGAKLEIQLNNELATSKISADEMMLQSDAKFTQLSKENSQKRIDDLAKEAEAKDGINQAYFQTLGNFGGLLSQLAGKNKALAISGVIVEQAGAIGRIISNTAVANAKAVAASPTTFGQPFVTINRINAGIGIASSIASAAKAINQIKSAGGDNSGGGGNLPTGGGGVSAPIAQGVSVQQTAVTNGVNIKNTDAIKAYVVERDITDSQDRINKIKAAATFGG
jgi:hypothetical protein